VCGGRREKERGGERGEREEREREIEDIDSASAS
jgi:hypothetical protein